MITHQSLIVTPQFLAILSIKISSRIDIFWSLLWKPGKENVWHLDGHEPPELPRREIAQRLEGQRDHRSAGSHQDQRRPRME